MRVCRGRGIPRPSSDAVGRPVVALLWFLTWGAAPATASGLGRTPAALQGFAPVSLDQADRYDVVYAVNEDGSVDVEQTIDWTFPPTRSGTASIARCRSAPDTGIRRRSIATTR